MQRALWKGAISFGLIHIPVELFAAEKPSELDLTMLDKRDFSPIGFKRINKETGKEVAWENIIKGYKGYEYADGEYVVLSEEDLKRANVVATQTIDIINFVDAREVPIPFFERPYYLAPSKGGEKVYALLRETLQQAAKIALAKIVLRTKQHLAALFAMDQVIVLNTLRYAEEIRTADDLTLPAKNLKRGGISDKEVKMALSLVEGMTEVWDPTTLHDTYREDVLALVKKKIKARQTKTIVTPDAQAETPIRPSAQIIDLTALLKRSIDEKTKGNGGAIAAADKPKKTQSKNSKIARVSKLSSAETTSATHRSKKGAAVRRTRS